MDEQTNEEQPKVTEESILAEVVAFEEFSKEKEDEIDELDKRAAEIKKEIGVRSKKLVAMLEEFTKNTPENLRPIEDRDITRNRFVWHKVNDGWKVNIMGDKAVEDKLSAEKYNTLAELLGLGEGFVEEDNGSVQND